MTETLIERLLEGRTLIILSNRGPVAFSESDEGELVPKRGGGGLVTAMSAVSEGFGAKWISAAMTPADRKIALTGKSIPFPKDDPSYAIRLIDIPGDIYERYYNRISNPLIWFVFHYLWNLADYPKSDSELLDDWRLGYEQANRLFAEAAVEEATMSPRPVIMLQDYHLFTAARYIKKALPDVPVMHFNHIPWPEPRYFKVLPKFIQESMVYGLLAADVLGFQVPSYAEAFLDCCLPMPGVSVRQETGEIELDGHTVLTRAYPISIEPDSLKATALGEDVRRHFERIKAENSGMRLIVRSDRADLSKNIVRGFEAYDILLTEHPEWKERVRFLAFLYPTREKLREYSDYRRRIETAVEDINAKHATDGWEPIWLRIKDDYPESMAALRIYDVLLVNPIFDGMNLVAKEGPLINEAEGVLVLSENAGSVCEMGAASVVVNPFDTLETAEGLHKALGMEPAEKRARSEWMKEIVTRNNSMKWLYHQLRDLAAVEPERERLLTPPPAR
ncbi:MAG: alpha,alpha-trehalose-phosphate synthase (UDP-forming) [Candidatus Aquicultorales bacterium]